MTSKVKYLDKPWLKHYGEGVPAELNYDKACVPEFLDRSTAKFPNLMALSFMGYQLNFKETKDMVDRLAAALTSYGIKKGDTVAILLPNTIPCVIAYYAVLKIGGIVVMNNPLYTDTELEYQFNDSGAKVLITVDLLGNRMIDLRPQTKIKQIIYTSIGDYLPFPTSVLFPLVGKKKGLKADVKEAPDVFKWKDVIAAHQPQTSFPKLDFEDVAMYQYSGGTTGVPKGAILSHGNISMQVQQCASWFPGFKDGEEIMLGALPFFHIFGISTSMNFGIYRAWGNILVPKPQPDPLIQTFKKFKPTFAPMVPTMYIGLINHPKIEKTDLSFIKGCFSGSAPIPLEVIKEFEAKTGAIICEGFGMSESSPVTHINPFVAGKGKAGSIGLPISDTVCRLVDITDRKTDVPVGEEGELIIQGPQVMKEYWGKPEETAKTIMDGWLHTGDIAKMDEEGFFYIVDRLKDMIISGGYNVYPRDIDEAYFENPKVEEACAIGLPHPTRGESIKVFIVLKQGQTATEEEMIKYAETKLAKYKLPTEVEFIKELPKTTVGKVLRKELRAQEIKKRGLK